MKASQVKGDICVDWRIIYCFTFSQSNPIAADCYVTFIPFDIANDAIGLSSGDVLEHCSERKLNLLFLNELRQGSQRTANRVTEEGICQETFFNQRIRDKIQKKYSIKSTCNDSYLV